MTVHELNLSSLMEQLDGGRINEAFMAELRRVALDCEDRPADSKTRKVSLELQIEPIVDDQGQLDSLSGKFHVTSSVPKRRSKSYSFGFRRGGKLVFNDLSDDNIHQQTIE
ncbi:MAG: hypothetical protein ACYC4U_11200 [Pirellulaceae bacterium]